MADPAYQVKFPIPDELIGKTVGSMMLRAPDGREISWPVFIKEDVYTREGKVWPHLGWDTDWMSRKVMEFVMRDFEREPDPWKDRIWYDPPSEEELESIAQSMNEQIAAALVQDELQGTLDPELEWFFVPNEGPGKEILEYAPQLVDVEERNRANPDTFQIPSRAARMSLRPDDYAKVILETPEAEEGPWMKVTEVLEPGLYEGQFPPMEVFTDFSSAWGKFSAEHIAGIITAEEAERIERGHDPRRSQRNGE